MTDKYDSYLDNVSGSIQAATRYAYIQTNLLKDIDKIWTRFKKRNSIFSFWSDFRRYNIISDVINDVIIDVIIGVNFDFGGWGGRHKEKRCWKMIGKDTRSDKKESLFG